MTNGNAETGKTPESLTPARPLESVPFQRPSLLLLTISTTVTWILGLTNPTTWTFYSLAICWLVFGGYILYQLIKTQHYRLAFVPVVFVIVICIGVSLPSETFRSLIAPLNKPLMASGSPLPAGKLGHIFCFSMLALFCLAVRKRLEIPVKDLFATMALLGLATEGIQLFIAGRTPTLKDFGFDLIGLLIGTLIFLAGRPFLELRKKPDLNEQQ